MRATDSFILGLVCVGVHLIFLAARRLALKRRMHSQVALRQLDETLLLALEEIDNAMVDFGQEELRRAGLQKPPPQVPPLLKAAREKFALGVGIYPLCWMLSAAIWR